MDKLRYKYRRGKSILFFFFYWCEL